MVPGGNVSDLRGRGKYYCLIGEIPRRTWLFIVNGEYIFVTHKLVSVRAVIILSLSLRFFPSLCLVPSLHPSLVPPNPSSLPSLSPSLPLSKSFPRALSIFKFPATCVHLQTHTHTETPSLSLKEKDGRKLKTNTTIFSNFSQKRIIITKLKEQIN